MPHRVDTEPPFELIQLRVSLNDGKRGDIVAVSASRTAAMFERGQATPVEVA